MQGRLEQLHLSLMSDRRCKKGAVYEDDLAVYEAGSFELSSFQLQAWSSVQAGPLR